MECSFALLLYWLVLCSLPIFICDLKGQDMANPVVQSNNDPSLMEMTFSTRKIIDLKLAVATPKIHQENKIELVELFRRLSELVDGVVRISRTRQLPIGKSENPNQWNIFECTDAILSIVGANVGAQFQRSSGNYRGCDCSQNSLQTTITGPCAVCISDRSSLLTKSCGSQAGIC
jgi:hypothetical protein